MIYHLLLSVFINYVDDVKVVLTLITPDDLEEERLVVDASTIVDANLDALVTFVDSDVTLPTFFNGLDPVHELNYSLERDIADTIELNSVMTLLSNLS